VVCGNADDVGAATFERRLRAFGDPRFTQFGAAFGWDQACVAASGDLFRTPAWVPAEPDDG
jgi:hypothetical protein